SWCSTIRIGWSIARSWRARRSNLNTPSTWIFKPRGAHPPCSRARRRLAAAFLLALDEVEQQAARRKAGQRPPHAVGEAPDDHAAALFQAAIAVSRHLLGRALENARKSVV